MNDFVMSTNVPLVANLPASGKSSYATYISADEMMFSIGITAGEPAARQPSLIKLNPVMGTDCKQRSQARAAVETEREGFQNGRCDSPILHKFEVQVNVDAVALGGFEDVPDESNFKANIYQFAPNAFDPGGEIGGAVSLKEDTLNSAVSEKRLYLQANPEATPVWGESVETIRGSLAYTN